MIFLRVLALAVLMATCTMFFGWMTVPLLAAVFALALRRESAPGEAALAALLAWGALLARVAMVPAFSTMLPQVGQIFQVPGWAVAVLSILVAVLLAWSAARVVSAVVARTTKA